MDGKDRKAAVAAYRKREAMAGVYAVRSGLAEAWVGHARDIDAIGNRLWFALRAGSHANRDLQAAWNRDGEDAFAIEPLELVDAGGLGFSPDKVLRERAAEWRVRLGASAV